MGDWGYLILKIAVTLVVIAVLVGLVYWLVRRYSAIGLGGIGRGRVPRLAVVDALTVDRRRRLLLVRRDNVEHLILIGGPSDVVVEATIQRGRSRQASRGAAPAQQPPPLDIPAAQESPPNDRERMQQQPTEPPATAGVPTQPEAPAGNVERLAVAAERPAPVYRTERRAQGAIDTQQLLDSINQARQAGASAEPAAAPSAYARDFRVVSAEPLPEPPPPLPDSDPAVTKISDLEQEMARLLGQLNVKRP
jgi:hypothetical protein